KFWVCPGERVTPMLAFSPPVVVFVALWACTAPDPGSTLVLMVEVAPEVAPAPLVPAMATWQPTTYPGWIRPTAVGSEIFTSARPDTHTLRCVGVAPIDGEMLAVSPVRLTVTVVPSGRVSV